MPHTNKVEEIITQFNKFKGCSCNNVQEKCSDCPSFEQNTDWLRINLTQALSQTKQETIEECMVVVPNKIEYSEPSIGGDLQSIKYKNHKELGYNQARTDFIKALEQLKQNK